jgi:hypothetical protein
VCLSFFKVLSDFGNLEIKKIETFVFTTPNNVRAGLIATTAAGAKVRFVRINALADVAHWEPTINVLEQSCL